MFTWRIQLYATKHGHKYIYSRSRKISYLCCHKHETDATWTPLNSYGLVWKNWSIEKRIYLGYIYLLKPHNKEGKAPNIGRLNSTLLCRCLKKKRWKKPRRVRSYVHEDFHQSINLGKCLAYVNTRIGWKVMHTCTRIHT